MILLHRLFVATFLTVLLESSRAQDPSTYCRLSTKHTMCRFQDLGERCGGSVSVRGVEDKNRQIILQTHNSLRSILASGQELRGQPGPQPQASNMQIMTWDEELAAVAQRLAEQCLFEHDCNECRKVGRFPVGQNLGVEWTTGPPITSNWKKMVTKWYEEVEEFPNTSARKFEFSVVTGHYSQIIWAETNRVGCGFTTYRENGTFETNLYVCNYGPAGNFIGLPSYKVGPPCSQCPANMSCSNRFTGLCEPSTKKPTTETSLQSLPEANEIIPSGSTTEKPTRQPPKVTTTTPIAANTQRPTATPATAVTQQQQPTTTTPIAVLQGPTLATSRRPFVTAFFNTTATPELKDFVCQVGKEQCQALFRGTPWFFRAQPSSFKPSYLETNVRTGELTELQINYNFPAPKENSRVCMSFQLKQEGNIEQNKSSSWLKAPLLIKIQPEKSQSVVVPIDSGEEGKWVELKLTVSRIRTPFKLLFQQTGPTPTDGGTISSRSTPNIRLSLGEIRIINGSCKP